MVILQESRGKTDRHRCAATLWLIAGLVLLCIIPAVMAATPAPTVNMAKVVSAKYIDPGILFFPICIDPLTIDPQVNTPQVKPDAPATVTFIVRNQSGFSVHSANVTVTSSGGTLSKTSGSTDSAGRMSVSFSSPVVGTFFVNATVSSGFCSADTSTQIVVESEPPAAEIAANPASPAGPAPLAVVFDASRSAGAGGATITAWSWTFSDGGSAATQSVSHTFDREGTFTVTLVVTDSHGKKSPQESVSYVVSPKTSLAVGITADQASVRENATTALVIHVTGKDGKPVAGANVTLTSTAEGSVTPPTGQTDATGTARFVFTGIQAGNATVTAQAESPLYLAGTQPLTIRVTPAEGLLPVPLALVAAVIVIVLIVAAVLLYLWTRSTLQLKPKQKEIPADGRSVAQIRVQFLNGFGQAKKQRREREIHLEATAGKIQDVVIPEGKEYADAALTSSKECGLVTVTAATEDKARATAEVRFTGDEAAIAVEITPAEIPADGKSTATIVLKIKDRAGADLSYLDEKVIGLSANLGTVPDVVKIEPRAPSGIATITSGDRTGLAVVRARTGSIAGEGRVQFRETRKKWCQRCGKPIEWGTTLCPSCGKEPVFPGGGDTKTCPACQMELPPQAVFCDKCGSKQPPR